MRFVFVVLAALGGFASTAGAEQYWCTYEGNDLPENEGWERQWGDPYGPGGPGAIRTLADGVLTMDSLFDQSIYDFARIRRPGELDPGVGEVFVAEWRLKVDEVTGDYYDPSVSVNSDDSWIVGFGYYRDRIASKFEDNVWIPFAPDVCHDYKFVSWDMRTYELYIDGDLAHVGTFWDGLTESYVAWGDVVSGAASRSHWDYVRFGVIPEPASFVMLLALGIGLIRTRVRLVVNT